MIMISQVERTGPFTNQTFADVKAVFQQHCTLNEEEDAD